MIIGKTENHEILYGKDADAFFVKASGESGPEQIEFETEEEAFEYALSLEEE